jgi:hypothetical protein
MIKKKSGSGIRSGTIGWISLLLIAIIMLATNPSQNDFKDYLKEHAKKEAWKDNDIAGAVSEVLAGPSSWIAEQIADRKNFLFFSWYTINILEEKDHYIGVFSNFIAL